MKIIVKYQTHLTKGEKSFGGKTAEARALSFARKLRAMQVKTNRLEQPWTKKENGSIVFIEHQTFLKVWFEII